MTTNRILVGIQLLLPYYDQPDGYHMSAEHDEIFMHKPDKPLPDDVLERLRDLGWRQDQYEESWKAFV